MTGKENVIAAMRSGARFYASPLKGPISYINRYRKSGQDKLIPVFVGLLQFQDGSTERVHGRTVEAVLATGLVQPLNMFDPWSPMAQEWVLQEA